MKYREKKSEIQVRVVAKWLAKWLQIKEAF